MNLWSSLDRCLIHTINPCFRQFWCYICSCSGGQRRSGCENEFKSVANIIYGWHWKSRFIGNWWNTSCLNICPAWIRIINPPLHPVATFHYTGEDQSLSLTGIGCLRSETCGWTSISQLRQLPMIMNNKFIPTICCVKEWYDCHGDS